MSILCSSPGAHIGSEKVSLTKPTVGANEVLIRGKTRNSQIHYGIEQVYVPESKGGDVERSGDLKADVKVDGNGTAVLQRVETKTGRAVYDAKSVSLLVHDDHAEAQRPAFARICRLVLANYC